MKPSIICADTTAGTLFGAARLSPTYCGRYAAAAVNQSERARIDGYRNWRHLWPDHPDRGYLGYRQCLPKRRIYRHEGDLGAGHPGFASLGVVAVVAVRPAKQARLDYYL